VSVTNGIDVRRFYPPDVAEKTAMRKRMNIPRDHTVFVYTGKLNHGKGLDVLLKAWKRLMESASRRDYLLLLVGSGGGRSLSCAEDLKRFVAENHLGDSVVFTGFVEYVEEYLKASDCFIIPSLSDGLGVSLLEALAAGLPAIVSDVGRARDVVTDGRNGLLVPVGDDRALVEKMRWVVSHPVEARELAHAGRESVIENFSISRIAGDYSRLFGQVRSCRAVSADL
jgi:glycosyltransferase involved in cell wall biosynthesis